MKDLWLRFRASNAFLYALATFLVGWFILRAIFHFDPDNGWLNIILSSEASIASCMILDLQFRTMRRDEETLTRLLESERKVISVVTGIEEDLEQHNGDVS